MKFLLKADALTQYILISFLSLHSSQLLLLCSDPILLCFLFRKEKALRDVSQVGQKQDTRRKGNSLPIEGGQGSPTEGRKFQEEARESETHPLSLLGVPQNKLMAITYIQRACGRPMWAWC